MRIHTKKRQTHLLPHRTGGRTLQRQGPSFAALSEVSRPTPALVSSSVAVAAGKSMAGVS